MYKRSILVANLLHFMKQQPRETAVESCCTPAWSEHLSNAYFTSRSCRSYHSAHCEF